MIAENENMIELFVPGRLCIIGEHSDWAGVHRMTNAEILPGKAIVTGTEQGIYATVEKSDVFSIESDLELFHGQIFSCAMDASQLTKVAAEGGFFSYVAGVASYACENFFVGGLKIRVTRMDLPSKSGLSSSAAICVLVARAFNRLYKLRLNTLGEMRMAYFGEQRTPSRCGRLDQACAFGNNPVCMTFDGTEISVEPLTVKAPLYFVVSDLKAGKDTVKILADLNKCFPFAENEVEKNVQQALGVDNTKFVAEAVKAIEAGDAPGLGKVMADYQQNFDKKIAPACYSQLRAPVLHSVLKDEAIQPLIYGAKGVGSQGDGSVQFLAKNENAQKQLIGYLKAEYSLDAFSLTISPKNLVKKAIIPVAGYGTRLFPATKIIKKDFFPVLDRDGIMKPVIMILLEQLMEAGIEDICLVIGEEEKPLYDLLFSKIPSEYYDRLPDEKKKCQKLLMSLKDRVSYVYQKEKMGFGHAVFQCCGFTAGEPVLLLLGDTIYHSNRNENCMCQMIDAYKKTGLPVIGMHKIPEQDVVHYGIMHGQWESRDNTMMRLDRIAEKPTVEYAREFLRVGEQDEYYSVFGQYILTDDVFDTLEKKVSDYDPADGREIDLTSALDYVREKKGMMGFLVDGTSYDVGLPEEYVKTLTSFKS